MDFILLAQYSVGVIVEKKWIFLEFLLCKVFIAEGELREILCRAYCYFYVLPHRRLCLH